MPRAQDDAVYLQADARLLVVEQQGSAISVQHHDGSIELPEAGGLCPRGSGGDGRQQAENGDLKKAGQALRPAH